MSKLRTSRSHPLFKVWSALRDEDEESSGEYDWFLDRAKSLGWINDGKCSVSIEDGSVQVHRNSHLFEEYPTWYRMMSRVYCMSDPDYPHIGGNGIKVCRRWVDFREFRKWLHPIVKKIGLKCDRKFIEVIRYDKTVNYEPSNCTICIARLWVIGLESHCGSRNQ